MWIIGNNVRISDFWEFAYQVGVLRRIMVKIEKIINSGIVINIITLFVAKITF